MCTKLECTRWFKYDLDKCGLFTHKSVPVIFEPPCTFRVSQYFPRHCTALTDLGIHLLWLVSFINSVSVAVETISIAVLLAVERATSLLHNHVSVPCYTDSIWDLITDSCNWCIARKTNCMEQRPSWEANMSWAGQEIFAFYGNQRFIAAFTTARCLFLYWARSIQSMLPSHFYRRILILSFNLLLGLPSGLLPSGFLTKALYAPPLSPIRATCPTHLSLLDLREKVPVLIPWENQSTGAHFFI
jgi:hypothetical protein